MTQEKHQKDQNSQTGEFLTGPRNRETQKIMGALIRRRREARENGDADAADTSAIARQWRSEFRKKRSA